MEQTFHPELLGNAELDPVGNYFRGTPSRTLMMLGADPKKINFLRTGRSEEEYEALLQRYRSARDDGQVHDKE